MLKKITPILCFILMFSCGLSHVFAQALITHTENNELGLKEIVPEELVFIGQNGDQLFFRDAGHIVLYQFDKKLKQTGRHCMAASSLSRMNNFQFPIPIDERIFYFNYYVQPGESASLIVKSSDGELQTLLQTNLKGADKSRSFAIKRVLTSAAGKYVLLHLDSYNGDVYTERFIACDSKMQIVWN